MTPEQLQDFLHQLQSAAPLIGVGLLALAVLLFLMALRNFRKSRTDSYWRKRRAAGQRGWRMFIWSLVLSAASASVCIIVGVVGLANARPLAQQTPVIVALAGSPTGSTSSDLSTATFTPTATHESSSTPTQQATASATIEPTRTDTATSSPTQPPTNTPSPIPTQMIAASASATEKVFPSAVVAAAVTGTATAAPTVTATLSPSATNTTSPTSTATVTSTPSATITLIPSETATLPVPTAIAMEVIPPLDSSVKITIASLDIQIATSSTPVNPGSNFAAGFTRLYFWVNFTGIKNGTLWRRQLIRDGKVLENNQYRWGQLEDGTSYFFFGQEGGFLPGNYQIKLFFGASEQPAAVATFTVK